MTQKYLHDSTHGTFQRAELCKFFCVIAFLGILVDFSEFELIVLYLIIRVIHYAVCNMHN